MLDGYRHELGSLLRVSDDVRIRALSEDFRDLILHLIASHHGHARPTIPTRSCDEAPPSLLAGHAQQIALRFAKVEQQWGSWGLAWLESLLRATDHAASRDNDDDFLQESV